MIEAVADPASMPLASVPPAPTPAPAYQPPRDVLDVLHKIEFEEAPDPHDPRRVDTREARSSQGTYGRLARKLGLQIENNRFRPPSLKHVLFFGHVGSGKTTELKFYSECLRETELVFSVEIDVPGVLGGVDEGDSLWSDLLLHAEPDELFWHGWRSDTGRAWGGDHSVPSL